MILYPAIDLKGGADEVTVTNADDGVAQVLERWW